MRNIFGWDLPPGCTQRHIDEAAGAFDDEDFIDDAGLEHAEEDYQDGVNLAERYANWLDNDTEMLSWHHACQSQASAARYAGYRVVDSELGWLVWATDADFSNLVIQAGER